MPEQFVVGLTPLSAAARVARHRSALRWRILSGIASGVILALLLYFLPAQFGSGWATAAIVLWALTSVLWITASSVGLHRAKRDLASIGNGDALVIDSQGITFLYPSNVSAAWAEIGALKVTGPSFGAGPQFVMEVDGQRVAKIPVSFLDALPAAIDSAVSARSLGRVRLDVSDMDRMI